MKTTLKRNLQKGALVLSSTLLGLIVVTKQITWENADSITGILGQENAHVIHHEVENEDPIHFKSDFKSIKEVAYNIHTLIGKINTCFFIFAVI